MAETPQESAGSHPARTHCVLLAAGGEHPPERLMTLLDEPSTQTVTVAHPLLAAAELARLERERQASLSSRSDEDEDRIVLVVVNRESWRDLSPLFRMVRLQMPRVSIWVCTERVAIEVYAGNEYYSQQEDAEIAPVPTATTPAQPTKSRLDGSEQGDPADVSDEELRLLLELFDAHDEADDDSEHGE